MSTILFANNASSTLAGAISNTAVTCNLAVGTGVLFPAPGAGQYFVGTFNDAATGLLTEIVHVTNVTVDTITIVRAQEGTTALNWNAGDLFANLLTAGTLQTIEASIPSSGGIRVVAGGSTIAPLSTDGTVVIKNATTSPTVYQMPSSPATGLKVAIKDGAGNFGAASGSTGGKCTVVTTDGTQIDGIAGATGYIMSADWQATSLEFDGTEWGIY